tara:strand:+ start:126 stop:386 length:261 start_codon:yes stop_codon:yes gene_type:complete
MGYTPYKAHRMKSPMKQGVIMPGDKRTAEQIIKANEDFYNQRMQIQKNNATMDSLRNTPKHKGKKKKIRKATKDYNANPYGDLKID